MSRKNSNFAIKIDNNKNLFMKEASFCIICILALIGLCLVIGLLYKAFDSSFDSSNEDGGDSMFTTLGSGCGIIIMIATIAGPILAVLCWLFG